MRIRYPTVNHWRHFNFLITISGTGSQRFIFGRDPFCTDFVCKVHVTDILAAFYIREPIILAIIVKTLGNKRWCTVYLLFCIWKFFRLCYKMSIEILALLEVMHSQTCLQQWHLGKAQSGHFRQTAVYSRLSQSSRKLFEGTSQ